MKLMKKGFTLIEVVVTMMIVVMVFGVLANLVGFSTKFFRDESTQVANQESLRLIAVYFEKDARMLISTNNDLTFDSITNCYSLGSSTIVTYCLDANSILRNGVEIGEGIAIFDVVNDIANSAIHLEIISIPDNRNITIEITYMIRIRTGETGSS